MEYLIIGLVMWYAWIHSVVICAKKLQGLTQYEKVVCWVGVASFALFLIGYLAE